MCVIFPSLIPLDIGHCSHSSTSMANIAWGLEELKSNSLGGYPVGKAVLSFSPCYLGEFLLYIYNMKKKYTGRSAINR